MPKILSISVPSMEGPKYHMAKITQDASGSSGASFSQVPQLDRLIHHRRTISISSGTRHVPAFSSPTHTHTSTS